MSESKNSAILESSNRIQRLEIIDWEKLLLESKFSKTLSGEEWLFKFHPIKPLNFSVFRLLKFSFFGNRKPLN